MQKTARHNRIVAMIEQVPIANQSELAAKLSDEGFSVTQASVSRDLVELGVVKNNGRYVLPTKAVAPNEYSDVSFIVAGPNLIVGRCSSGMASAITVRIDAAAIPEIVGTIAGDDTIFIAVSDTAAQSSALEQLTGLFE